MKLRFITREALDALEMSVGANSATYEQGTTSLLISDSVVRESRVEVELPPKLVRDDGEIESDADAAKAIYQWLQKLDATQSSDARLWTFLTHVTFAEYVHRRWAGSLEGSIEPEARIIERWFFRGEGSATLFRNGISRLWWFGRVTTDPTRGDPFELTGILLSLQELQVAFLERSLGRCRALLHAVLEVYSQKVQNAEISDRGTKIQRWARELNKLGGAYILDALPRDRLKFVVDQQLRRVLGE